MRAYPPGIAPVLERHSGSPASCHTLDAVQGFFEQMRSTDERKPQVVLAFLTERPAGDSGHARFLEQQLLHFFRRPPRVFDIHPRIKSSAGRLAAETRNAVQPRDEHVAALLELPDHCGHGAGRVFESLDRRNLTNLRGTGERVHHQHIERVDDILPGHRVAEPPAGHGKGFREAVNDDRSLGHSGQRADGLVLSREQNARVDFIRNDPQIVFPCEFGDALERFFVEYGAGRIAGRVKNEHARLSGDFPGDFIYLRLKPVFLVEPEGNRFGSEPARKRGIDRKTGIGTEHLVAWLDERHHRECQGHFAAGSDQHLFRRDFESTRAIEIVGDRAAQRGNTARRHVAVAATRDGGAQGIHNRRCRMKIRLAEFEMNYRSALLLEFLGARKNSERSLAAQFRYAGRDVWHGPKIISLSSPRASGEPSGSALLVKTTNAAKTGSNAACRWWKRFCRTDCSESGRTGGSHSRLGCTAPSRRR